VTLNIVLLFTVQTGSISGTDCVASYCTIYQFSELYLTGELVSHSPRYGPIFCFRICKSWKCCITHVGIVQKAIKFWLLFVRAMNIHSQRLTIF